MWFGAAGLSVIVYDFYFQCFFFSSFVLFIWVIRKVINWFDVIDWQSYKWWCLRIDNRIKFYWFFLPCGFFFSHLIAQTLFEVIEEKNLWKLHFCYYLNLYHWIPNNLSIFIIRSLFWLQNTHRNYYRFVGEDILRWISYLL